MKTIIGIDNGVTGAIASLSANDEFVSFELVRTLDLGKGRILDIPGNLAIIKSLAESAGGLDQVVVVYEQQQKNPIFGTKGNFSNGQNGEFWRVLLTLTGFAFTWVNPKTWQRELFKNIRGDNAKKTAKLYLDQRYPTVKLDGLYNQDQQEAVRDAMCIATWARITNH